MSGRHAVLTIVQDEPIFFPLWYRYYNRYYAARDIYILYHPLPLETMTPSWLAETVGTDANVIRVHQDTSFNHTWLRQQVEKFAAFLFGSYDTVLFTEVDEIVAVHPYKITYHDLDLRRSADRWWSNPDCKTQPAVRCTGHEVVHNYESEDDLDVDRLADGVLRYRSVWYPSVLYSKALLWRTAPAWHNGFHQAVALWDGGSPLSTDWPMDPNLLLLHLHKLDYRIARARLARTASRNWSTADMKGRVGIQNRLRSEDELREWWFRSIDDPSREAPLVPMPDDVKDII
jgi:hypothetical protein